MGVYSDYPGNLYKNEVGIYAEGVYNDDGIYKEGAGGGDLRECIFLTYFENFNSSTLRDVPQIGDPYTFFLVNKPQVYERGTIPDLYGGITALYNFTTQQDNSNSSVINRFDLSNYDVFSLELWFLNTGSRYDFQIYIQILQLLIFDPGFSSVDFLISGPFGDNQKANYSLYNGTVWSTYNSNYIKIGEQTRFINTFVSLVADRNKNEIRLYANGKIMYKISNFNIPNNVLFGCNNQNTQKQTYLTGLAVFTYDKSKDEEMNYPVPNQRYS